MCDVFLSEDIGKIFQNQHIVLLGDSQMRGVYKDFVWLLNHPSFIPNEVLCAKSEQRFPDMENTEWKQEPCEELYEIFDKENRDFLLDTKGLTSGRTFIEPRQYYNKKYNICINYVFIVRAYSEEIKEFLVNYEERYKAPIGTILMNSTLWDINRWGPFYDIEYKKNVQKILEIVPKVLPKNGGSFFWLTCPPIAKETESRGMNVPGLEFQCSSTRFNVVEANNFAVLEVIKAGYGVVDLHHLLLLHQHRRKRDGIHYDSYANRMITNRVLTIIQLWRRGEEDNFGLPGRIGCAVNNSDAVEEWVKPNFGLEMAKLKAKQIKEGPTSEEEIRKRIEELDSCLEPDHKVSREKVNSIRAKVNNQKLAENRQSMTGRPSYFPPDWPNNRFHPYASQNYAMARPPPLLNWNNPTCSGFSRPQAPVSFAENTVFHIDFRGGGLAMNTQINEPNNTDLAQEGYAVMNNMLHQEIRQYLEDSNGQLPSQNWTKSMRHQIINRLQNPMQAMQAAVDDFNRMAQGGFQNSLFNGPMRQQRMTGSVGWSRVGRTQNMENQDLNNPGYGDWRQGGIYNNGGLGGVSNAGYGNNVTCNTQYGNNVTWNTQYGNNITCNTQYGNNVTWNAQYGNNVAWNTQFGNNVTCNMQYGNNVTGNTHYGNNVTCNTQYGNNVTWSTQYGNNVTCNTQFGNNVTCNIQAQINDIYNRDGSGGSGSGNFRENNFY